jgi:hypothetical protein
MKEGALGGGAREQEVVSKINGGPSIVKYTVKHTVGSSTLLSSLLKISKGFYFFSFFFRKGSSTSDPLSSAIPSSATSHARFAAALFTCALAFLTSFFCCSNTSRSFSSPISLLSSSSNVSAQFSDVYI